MFETTWLVPVKDYYTLKGVVETVHQQNVHSRSMTLS